MTRYLVHTPLHQWLRYIGQRYQITRKKNVALLTKVALPRKLAEVVLPFYICRRLVASYWLLAFSFWLTRTRGTFVTRKKANSQLQLDLPNHLINIKNKT
jgi:hypothetical protein